MNRFKDLAAALSTSVCVVALAAPAQAQEQQFNIPPGPLRSSLDQFGRQSGRSVIYLVENVSGKRSNGVRGAMSAENGLKKILNGTGLTYKPGTDGAFAISLGNGPIIGQRGAQAVAASGAVDRGVVQGDVADFETGVGLRGAQIEIIELGLRTSTDDFGQFRFGGVKPGNYTVRVSFLGYRDAQMPVAIDGEGIAVEFKLKGGTSGEEVVVYGQRSARAQALNQERTADNVSTVISADLLGNFVGTTLSESLRRAPGVAFQRDPNTGDGVNVIIRGLEPDLNTVKFNGVELPEATGTGRAPGLSNILTDSISKVTISKTLLPNQDSGGTGGLVEIETKTPLDRPDRYASVAIEGAKRGRNFNSEMMAAGTLSGRFGAGKRWGISISAQYRKRNVKLASYQVADLLFPQHIPFSSSGQIVFPGTQDPRDAFPFDQGIDLVYPKNITISRSETKTKNLSLNGSLAWEPSDNTKLFLDFQRFQQTDTSISRSWGFAPLVSYTLAPVAALNGATAVTLAWNAPYLYAAIGTNSYAPDNKTSTNVLSFHGETTTGRWKFAYGAGYTKGQFDNPNYSMVYHAGGNLNSFNPAFVSPEALDPVEGRVVSPFGPRNPNDNSFVSPLLTQAGFDSLNDSSSYNLLGITHQIRGNGSNSRLTGTLNTNFEVGSKFLKYVEAGADFKASEFKGGANPAEGFNPVDFINTPSLNELGLGFTNSSLGDVGVNTGINLVSSRDLVQFFENALTDVPTLDNVGPNDLLYRTVSPVDKRLRGAYTREQELSPFIQAKFTLGELELVGGFRGQRVKVQSNQLQGPRIIDQFGVDDEGFFTANSTLLKQSVTATDILPRWLLSYRPTDNFVVRAGYYLSVARPQINLLSTSSFVTLDLRPQFGPDQNQPRLSVVKGNPGLKPSRTNNFDISLEYYDRSIGVFKVGAFLKKIDNFLEYNTSNGQGNLDAAVPVIPADPRFQDVIAHPANYFIQVQQPVNGASGAKIWGFEATAERRLTFLPGALGGFGVYSNVTYTQSRRNQSIQYQPVRFGPIETVIFKNQPFSGSPKWAGTIGLTYNKYGFDASIMYTAQSRRQLTFQPYNMSNYEEGFGTLDLRAEYSFKRGPGKYRLYLEGSDLLRGSNIPSLETTRGADDGKTEKYYDSARYFGGRQFRVGIAASL